MIDEAMEYLEPKIEQALEDGDALARLDDDEVSNILIIFDGVADVAILAMPWIAEFGDIAHRDITSGLLGLLVSSNPLITYEFDEMLLENRLVKQMHHPMFWRTCDFLTLPSVRYIQMMNYHPPAHRVMLKFFARASVPEVIRFARASGPKAEEERLRLLAKALTD